MKNLWLLIISLIFYAWGEPVYIFIMLFTICMDYVFGLWIEKCQLKSKNKQKTAVFIIAVIANLLILGFFKYTDFLITNVDNLFTLKIPTLGVALPIGVSFYTFQAMSYIIDVYRREVGAQKNIIDFGLFISLFPQLIAGPIVRYKTIAYQLKNRTESVEKFAYGVQRFAVGLAKKVLLANNIGLLYEQISTMNPAGLPASTAWIGAIAFTFQIYFDFSGYSDMAIGLSSMFGFEFLENFNYPYISKSITEFWRRWHISLGTWFKEYLYIPLGGSRNGKAKLIRNIIIVWAITGLWHGASWNFVIWGIYFGVLLIIEKLFLNKILEKLPRFIGHIYTMLFVILSWVIFAFDDMGRLGMYLKAMFGLNGAGFANSDTIYLFYTNIILIAICVIASTQLSKRFKSYLKTKPFSNGGVYAACEIAAYIGLFVLCICFMSGSAYNPFLYFRF
ncbi:MAG: MBOAT family O-acyltransferase [Clostridia bacterium]